MPAILCLPESVQNVLGPSSAAVQLWMHLHELCCVPPAPTLPLLMYCDTSSTVAVLMLTPRFPVCFCAAIPFIVHPIDNTIHALLNATLRPAMRRYVCGPGQGCLADLEMCTECKVAAAGEGTPSSTNGSSP